MEEVYRLYGLIHWIAKKIIGRRTLGTPKRILTKSANVIKTNDFIKVWQDFIKKSRIENSSFHYAGYVADCHKWILPSWIWTNAALVRTAIQYDRDSAIRIAGALLDKQEKCGGWIVRDDYDHIGPVPVMAPNDSAYIANNAMLQAYILTKDIKYLQSAIKCANWIIETSRPDGLVYIGLNMRDNEWDKKCVIVDTGFTAGLFAHLWEIIKDERYRLFLERFINRYIELFFIPSKNSFCTSINQIDKQQGGRFGRGQAWALEGLIPAYKVLKSERIKKIIERTVETLLSYQSKNGGWSYNFDHPLAGQDCKAVPVIAKSLLDWYNISKDIRCVDSAKSALNWCRNHTSDANDCRGGIFSYTIEGGIVKDLYSSCAFVYSSAYAIEVDHALRLLK